MFVCPECGTALPAPGACPTDGTALAPIGEDMLLGTTIGVYRVARLLGLGGMGRVYKGVHPGIGSRVAIKVLSRECSDRPDLVERFFAEARAVNLIRHESIVNVLDLARLPDGRPYIIMEYLDGSPLSSIIEHATSQQQRLPLGGVARLAAEVLDALAAAHAKGIIHRDLKPDNIYVTPSGRAKVLDFGIAKLTESTGTATQTGSLLGTPQYMSPEQAQGKPVDQRTDLYAMGVILFECVTNTRPFEAESLFDLLRHQIDSPPPAPRSRRPDLPPDFEAVILAALAKSPEHRFANAEAMSVALQHATAQLPQDQWAALVGNVRTGPAGWSPTPPASWSRSGARTAPSPPPTSPSLSAGQVTEPSSPPTGARPASSKKGLILGIAAVVVIGGAVAAALVFGAGGTPATTPPPVVAAGSASPTLDAAGSSSGGSGTVKDDRPPKPKADKPDNQDPDDKDDAEDDGEDIATIAAALEADPEDDAKMAALRKRARAMIAKLPPAKRAEYEKLLEVAKPDGVVGGAKVPKQGTGAWVTAHDLHFAFDPHRVDVGTYLAWAIAQGKAAVPDAVLTRVELEGVRPDGTADLTLPIGAEDHGEIGLRFVSPSRAKRDPSIPVGVHVDWRCQFRIEAAPKQIELRPLDGFECKEEVVPVPRCTAAALWKKAVAKKPALAGINAIAAMSFYRAFKDGKAFWYFTIQDTFSERFDDDC